jgi:hypothetical protein
VESVEGQRQELDMQGLHLAEAHQRMGVEGIGQAGDDAGAPAPGPALDHDRHREPAQREPGQQEDVVDGHRRPAEREERQSHHALHHHVLGEGERPWLGKEDVRVEELTGMDRQLMRHPGEDPGVQGRVGVVEARPRRQPGGERPGVHHGQRREER